MDISEAIGKIVGKQETIKLAGIDIIVYPLTYAEYLLALEMSPKAVYSAEELKIYEETGELPLKTPDTATTIEAIKQELYVIEVTLKKNDPDFDVKLLANNMKVFYAFEPLFERVWKISSPNIDIVKKKGSA